MKPEDKARIIELSTQHSNDYSPSAMAIRELIKENDELIDERDALLRGEFICRRCGIRKNADPVQGDF